MKMELKRKSIQIIPETEQDEVYLEEVLGLYRDGDSAKAVRVGQDDETWAFLEVKR